MELETSLFAPKTWARKSIESVCVRFTSGGTPSRKRPEFFANGTIPWVKTKELTDWLIHETEEEITRDAIANSSAKLLPKKTVLMAMYGATVGQLAILGREMACNQACAAMVVDDTLADYRFLFYQLLANRQQIKGLSTGAAQQNLSGRQIKEFIVAFPSLCEQRAIADVLWLLDSRRALLSCTNATLESIAQAIFKSWFIDFDPVHAKAAGQEPEGMDAATAMLFPGEFEDSELGPIPKGWTVGPLKSLCVWTANGATPARRKADYWNNGVVPWFKTGELTDAFLTTSQERVTDCALERTSVKVFPRHSVLMAIYAAPTVGRLGILTEAGTFNQACTGLVARPDVGPWFLFQTLFHARDWFNNRANGAAQQNISKGIVDAYPCIQPPPELLSAFNAVANRLYATMENNTSRIETLATIRDTILPRLISGKLRVPEAEELVKEVVS